MDGDMFERVIKFVLILYCDVDYGYFLIVNNKLKYIIDSLDGFKVINYVDFLCNIVMLCCL